MEKGYLKMNPFNIYFEDFIYLFLERGERREKERERNTSLLVASHVPPPQDLACNPGTCPDWESTSDLSVCRPALNPVSHTRQGQYIFNTGICMKKVWININQIVNSNGGAYKKITVNFTF